MLHHLTNALKRMPVALAATAASLLVVGAAAAAGTTWSAPEESSEQPAPEPTTVATIDTDSTVTSAVTAEDGSPSFSLQGTVLARADELGVAHVHVSMSHDAGIASAVVVLER